MKIWMMILAVSISSSAQAEDRIGKIYEKGKTNESPLYILKMHREKNSAGKIELRSTIEDASGKVVMRESALMDGTKMISQEMQQLQIEELYELEVNGSEATFRTFAIKDGKKDKKISQKTQRIDDNFVTGPSTEAFLLAHADQLVSGKKVEAEFGIFELEKSVSFRFMQRKSPKDSLVFVNLRPSSFWLSLLVDPIDFDVDAKTFRMKRYIGRTPVRQWIHGKWKPFDAEILYSDL